jgi:hypothetical protein
VSVVSFARSDRHEWVETGYLIRPAQVLQFALLLLAVGNLGRIPLLDLGQRQAPILINDVCVGAVLLAGALAAGRARSLKLNDVALSALLFAGIGAISAVSAMPRFGLTAFELIASLAYLARWLVYFGVYIVVINCLRSNDVEPAWNMIERVLLLMAAFGVVQAIFLPNFAFIVYPDAAASEFDAQRNRLVSTILDPNVMAGMIGIVLLIQLSRLAFGVIVPFWKPLLLFASLVMTLSRGGALSFFVGVLFVLSVRGLTKRTLKLGTLVLVLVALASPWIARFAAQYTRFSVTDGSALARVYTWQRAIELFLDNPWFGVGFNTYGFVQEHRGIERVGVASYSAEGGLLFIAVMTGLVGLLVYLGMLWFILRRCKRGWVDQSATPAERGLFLGVGAATVAVLVNTIFVNTLFIPFVMELLWVLWGLTFVMSVSLRERTQASASIAQVA